MTQRNPCPLEQWLASIIGRELVTVHGLVFFSENGRRVDPVQAVSLQFGEATAGSVTCGGDGSSIEWNGSNLLPADMKPYGRQEVLDISREEPWTKVIGRKLRNAQLLHSERECSDFGIELEFGRTRIAIANLGDELFVGHVLPDQVLIEERMVRRNPRKAE